VNRHTELCAPRLQDLEKSLATHRGEAVATARDRPVFEVDVYVVPSGELALHLRVDLLVSMLDATERLIGEDHAEAEGVVGGVAFPHGYLMVGVELLGERREVETTRSAADHRNPHACSPWVEVLGLITTSEYVAFATVVKIT